MSTIREKIDLVQKLSLTFALFALKKNIYARGLMILLFIDEFHELTESTEYSAQLQD